MDALPGRDGRVAAGQRLPAGDAGRAERAAGARDGARRAPGDRASAPRFGGVPGSTDGTILRMTLGIPIVTCGPGQPAHPPPGRRVRGGRGTRRRGEDLRRVGAQLPRSRERAAPRLRAVEAFPVEQEGERYRGAARSGRLHRRPSSCCRSALLEIVALFDGEHSIADIQAEMHAATRRAGRRGEQHRGARSATLDEHGLPRQPGASRRGARPSTATFLAAPRPPGQPRGRRLRRRPGRAARARWTASSPRRPGPGAVGRLPRAAASRGLIAPHIDFHRGGPAYAWAYRDLAERGDADLLRDLRHLPRGHGAIRSRSPARTTTRRSAPARVDRDFVEALARRARARTASAPSWRTATSTRSSSRRCSCSYLYARPPRDLASSRC